MNKSTFEEEINKTGKLIYTSVGNSMMPIIHENCDILIIEKVSGRLKKELRDNMSCTGFLKYEKIVM